jgi:hypothetical protein
MLSNLEQWAVRVRGTGPACRRLIGQVRRNGVRRIDYLIDKCRVLNRRRLLRRAIKLWRAGEADRQLAGFDAPPERVG